MYVYVYIYIYVCVFAYIHIYIYIFGFEDPAGWSWTYIERSICILYTIYTLYVVLFLYTNAYRRRERNKTLVVWRLGHDAPRPYTALRTSGHGSPGESQKWRKGKHVMKRYWKTFYIIYNIYIYVSVSVCVHILYTYILYEYIYVYI